MASIYVNVNGSYKQAGDVWVQKDGTWKYANRAINARVTSTETNEWKEPRPPLVQRDLYAHYDPGDSNTFFQSNPPFGSYSLWFDKSGNGRTLSWSTGDITFSDVQPYNRAAQDIIKVNGGSAVTDERLNRNTFNSTAPVFTKETFFNHNHTISFWISQDASNVNVPAESGEDAFILMECGVGSSNGGYHIVQRAGSYRFGFFANDLDSYGRAVQNHWQYVSFSYNHFTGEKSIYINGQFDNSAVGTPFNMTDDSQFALFNFADTPIVSTTGNTCFHGFVGQIHAYNGCLTGKEIRQNYEATKHLYGHHLNSNDNFGIIRSGLDHHLGYSTPEKTKPTAILFDNYQELGSLDGIGSTVYQNYNDNNRMISKISPWYANLVNGPTVSTANNGYVDFDGSNDYASVPSFTMPNVPFTVECFFNYDSVSAYEGICGINSTAGGTNPFMQLERDGGSTAGQTGTMQFSVGNTSGQKNELHTTTVLATGTWYHLVATATSSEMKVYLNNTLEATLDVSGQTLTTPVAGGSDLIIGASIYNNAITAHADVKIGKFRIYSKALSQLEVTHNWNTQKGFYGL